MNRFFKKESTWIAIAILVASVAWGVFGYAWFTGALTFENVLVVPTALWVFSLGAFAALLGVYLIWVVVGEPIVAIMWLRPRHRIEA